MGCKNNSHVFRGWIKFLEWNFRNIILKKNVSSSLAIFWNILEKCKIGTFQRNCLQDLKAFIYLFTKIFQNVKIVMLQWNILQYLTKILRQYFNCNARLEIFFTCFCNILCYVGSYYIYFFIFYCLLAKKMETEKWPKAADSLYPLCHCTPLDFWLFNLQYKMLQNTNENATKLLQNHSNFYWIFSPSTFINLHEYHPSIKIKM